MILKTKTIINGILDIFLNWTWTIPRGIPKVDHPMPSDKLQTLFDQTFAVINVQENNPKLPTPSRPLYITPLTPATSPKAQND